MSYPLKQFEPNVPQLRNIMMKPTGSTSIWGRGTGKSSDMGWLVKTIIEDMPRSLWAIVGRTFTDILSNTLPTTIGALEDLGYVKGRDFFINRKAPAKWNWPEPFRPPLKSEHAIWTRSGAVFIFISQDRLDSNRGLNLDGIICDEGLNLIRDRFEREILIANRSSHKHKKRFEHCPLHHGVYIYTSMPYTAEGRWLLEHADYYNKDGHNYDLISKKIVKKQLEIVDTPDAAFRRARWKEVLELKKQIRYYKNKANFLYTEANVFDNHHLNFGYILQLRKQLLDIVFRIEVLNEKLKLIEKSFYPSLNEERHFYSAFNYSEVDNALGEDYNYDNIEESAIFDIDPANGYDPSKPLEIGVDFGALINWIVVSQDHGDELRIINSFYVKTPKILDHVFQDFCEYYKFHKEKSVFFHYDPATGNSRKDNSIYTSAEQAAAIMRSEGWMVKPMTKHGSNVFHFEKFQMINKILLEDDDRLPIIRINRDRNKDLIISIINTGVKQTKKKMEKDKSSETLKSMQATREHATDGSDAFDILLWGKFKDMWDMLNTDDVLTTITFS